MLFRHNKFEKTGNKVMFNVKCNTLLFVYVHTHMYLNGFRF